MSTQTNELNGALTDKTSERTSDLDASNEEITIKKEPVPNPGCEMCSNYELQLQQLQSVELRLRQDLESAQLAADRHRTDLSAERLARSELEAKVTSTSSQVHNSLSQAEDRLEELTSNLSTLENTFSSQLDALKDALKGQMDQRIHLEEEMKNLTHHYAELLGSHRRSASAMRNEAIELPNSISELQELCLQLREELIETRAGREHENLALNSEVKMLRDQLSNLVESRDRRESLLADEITELRTRLAVGQSHESAAICAAQKLEEKERRLAECQSTVDDLEVKLTSVQNEKGELEFSLRNAQKQLKTLQQDLSTSETVQKDFVKLSQSLQIELEKIRQAEQEVRWQWPEDCTSCNGCRKPLESVQNDQKRHCLHCGKIFCDPCLGHTVPSGPSARLATVCTICHTLLCRDAAPYFSDSATERSTAKVSPKQKA